MEDKVWDETQKCKRVKLCVYDKRKLLDGHMNEVKQVKIEQSSGQIQVKMIRELMETVSLTN